MPERTDESRDEILRGEPRGHVMGLTTCAVCYAKMVEDYESLKSRRRMTTARLAGLLITAKDEAKIVGTSFEFELCQAINVWIKDGNTSSCGCQHPCCREHEGE